MGDPLSNHLWFRVVDGVNGVIVMIKKLAIVSAVSISLFGCGGGDEVSDNDIRNPGSDDTPRNVVSLASAKLGTAGGFVDVDGDGKVDMVAGAPSATKGDSLGAMLIYKGGSSTLHGITSVTPVDLTGDNSFGSSFVNLGDIDGDGKDDYAIGAIYGDGDDVSMSGAVHIYKGGSNGQVIKKLAGEIPMDRFGMVLASGDLNGDGKGDIIIGAPYNTSDLAAFQSGAVYAYLAPGFSQRIKLGSSSTASGSRALGWSIASGDINNDGVDDLLIGASGKVLGFYGSKTSFSPDINSPDVRISSPATDFGKAIAVIGDVDGDGIKELAIGAPRAMVGTNRDTGMMFIVKGGTGTRSVDLKAVPTPADQIVRIDGANLLDRFGAAIAAVDAKDGSGAIDVAVSAPLADVNGNSLAGKVYLFKAADLGPAATIASATVFGGSEKYQGFGTSISEGPSYHLFVGMPAANGYEGEAAVLDLTGSHGHMLSPMDPGTGMPGGDGSDTHEHDAI